MFGLGRWCDWRSIMFCRYCKTEIDVSDKFCYKCGAVVENIEPIQVVEPVMRPEFKNSSKGSDKKSSKKVIFVVLELLAIGLWAYLTYDIGLKSTMNLKNYAIMAGFMTLLMLTIYVVFLLRIRSIRKGGVKYE